MSVQLSIETHNPVNFEKRCFTEKPEEHIIGFTMEYFGHGLLDRQSILYDYPAKARMVPQKVTRADARKARTPRLCSKLMGAAEVGGSGVNNQRV